MKIHRRVRKLGVTEQNLNGSEIRAGFQHVRGEAVAQDILVLLMIRIPRKSATGITRSME
jgi:hypothetical protein